MSLFSWRHGTASSRAAQNTVSTAGQIYVEEDTGRIAVGDGATTISALPLHARVSELANYGRPVSTDGTSGLPTPTGVGLEMVITAAGLQDIRFNGVSL